jgi:hypothetical protein
MDYRDYRHLTFERRDRGVGLVTIHRPEVLNRHQRSSFSRVAFFGTKQHVTAYMSERKRDRDSNTG